MLVLQLSDLHIKANRGLSFNAADSSTALERTVAHILELPQQPDCIVVSGDLAERGDPEGYAFVAANLARLSMPVYVLPGNHDRRENLLAALGAYCPADPAVAPYLCYTVEGGPLRLVVLDGTRPGSHSGHLDEAAARWLEKTLAARRDIPTLLFTHHPPFLSAMGRMDEPYENPETFANILQNNPQVRLCCGHLHRGIATVWAGVSAVVAPSLVLPIVPNLSPEGGGTFTLGVPGYLLHHLYAGQVNSHFCQVPGTYEYAGPYSFSKPPKLP